MNGEIEGQKMIKYETSYCMGEPLLMFYYENGARWSVAFATKEYLETVVGFIKNRTSSFQTSQEDNKVYILEEGIAVCVKTVNPAHAVRLKKILDNF